MSQFAGSFDSNVLLRLVLGDVPAQRTAALSLLAAHRKQFAVADTALYEIAFVLGRNYGFTREQIAETVQGIMSLEQINCNRVMFARALDMYVAYPALSLEDCALVAYAALNNAAPLYTFDQKLAKQSGGAQLITT